ncbi:MAG: hypothetical protein H6713_23940 [Myxococcales bacterium]|nr:hypothetical protein [Myxococcales bacterium]
MTDDDRRTEELPARVGAHRLYTYRGVVPVIVYRGDVSPAEVTEIVAYLIRGGLTPAIVSDISELGSFGAATRKAMIQARADIPDVAARDISVYVCGADVVRRALFTLAATVGRVLSRNRLSLLHRARVDEALAEVDQLLARWPGPEA